MHVVETRELRKSYGRAEVLHGIDLRVPLGALFGFLGPNGAGKTTTLRILLGLLRRSAGQALVFGEDAWSHGRRLRARVGYLPGDLRLYERMTGRRLLEFLAAARGVDCTAEVRRLAQVFDLDLRRRVGECSRGMKQKLGLIQALMHRPDLLVLDEPTTALDPLVREGLLQELRGVAASGRTVVFSSHTLSEVEELCDWVAIVRHGRLIEQETMNVLRGRAVRHVELRYAPGTALPEALPEGLHIIRREGCRLHASWVGPPAELLRWLAGQSVDDVTIAPPDLEDLFLAYYSRDEAEAGA